MKSKTAIATITSLLGAALADPAGHEWAAPAADASRSPCPMLNAMANHGFIPSSGRDISLDDLARGFKESINFVAPSLLASVGRVGLTTSTTGNASTFHLGDLAKHNVIEHDGSLSRQDAALGDHLRFDAAIWSQMTAFFTNETIPVETAVEARQARLADARRANPDFQLTQLGATAGILETALYQIVLGEDPAVGNPKTEFVKIFFEQERLPYNEGFEAFAPGITQKHLDDMRDKVIALSS